MPNTGPHNPIRRGVTLVELLVVISIIMLLVGVAVQAMGPTLEGRRGRETGRAVNIYFGSARARALETGRPCGVMIVRDKDRPGCSMKLEQVEVPPSYSGETLGATAQVQRTGSPDDTPATVEATLTGGFNAGLVDDGDLVQFNHQGPLYEIVGPPGGTLTLQIDVSEGQLLPWPPDGSLSEPVPYVIFRRPMKSFAEPLTLPAAAVIDLEASGIDPHGPATSFAPTSADDQSPIYIMFSPNGAVDRVYSSTLSGPVVNPIFLLVGKSEKIPAADVPDEENWRDLSNLWVTLNPQTGLVTTAEVVPADDPSGSRQEARKNRSMGGR